jgi:hypothetical protein
VVGSDEVYESMRTRRDFLTPAIVIFGVVIVIMFLWIVIAEGQTHTLPGANVVPSGATLTISSGGTINAAAGSTVTGMEVPLTFSQSVRRSLNDILLQGDSAAPGNTMFYGTNGSGTKGWYAQQGYATGISTWLATPSSANLRAAVTDENGTGALLFSGATAPDFTTGFTIGAAAAAGKIPIGNGTNYVPSTQTWPTAAGTAGYTIRSDGTNFTSYPQDMFNSSVTSQSVTTSDVYLTNSNVPVAAGDMKAKGQYRCIFDMTKSAGTGAIVITVRVGTAGAIGDPAILTFTFTAGTSVADSGTFEIIATWRTVGSGTSAVMQGICRANKNTATAAGLWGVANDSQTIVATTSSGFNSSTATSIGVSFNGSTAFAGTSTLLQATLVQ